MTWLGKAGDGEYYVPDLQAQAWAQRGCMLIRRDASFPDVQGITPLSRVPAESVQSVHSVPDSADAHLPKPKTRRRRRKAEA